MLGANILQYIVAYINKWDSQQMPECVSGTAGVEGEGWGGANTRQIQAQNVSTETYVLLDCFLASCGWITKTRATRHNNSALL